MSSRNPSSTGFLLDTNWTQRSGSPMQTARSACDPLSARRLFNIYRRVPIIFSPRCHQNLNVLHLFDRDCGRIKCYSWK